jgi:hypothetical protein
MESTPSLLNAPEAVQRKCAACARRRDLPKCEEELRRQPMEEEEELSSQGRPGGTACRNSSSADAHPPLRNGGQPLTAIGAQFFEPRIGPI